MKKISRFYSLNALRLIFFLGIFLSHYQLNGESFFSAGGAIGVTFFFVLSGFALSLGYGDRVDSVDSFEMRRFLKKRIIKLYPIHLLTLLLRAIPMLIIPTLMGENILKQTIAFFLNIVMLHAWIPDKELVFNYNMVAWFVSPIMFFYLVFPYLYKFISTCRASILVSFLSIILAIYLVLAPYVPDAQLYLYVAPYARVLDFAFGILLYRIYTNIVNKRLKVQTISILQWFAMTIALLSIIYIIYYYDDIDDCYRRVAVTWLPIVTLIFSIVFLEQNRGSCMFKSKWLQLCGDASYEMYMIHAIVISVFMHAGNNILGGNIILNYGWMLVSIFATIVLGILLHNYFCLPIIKKIHN